ncbi:MAG: hypothetical protein P1V51_23690 [Deltaproteobacteria bacterium]|nr:hypothetical protein [Deltaproteobacteria bacterium]
MRNFTIPLLALVWLGAACSLSLDLDEREGHPCSAQGKCLPGYRCVEAVCVPTEGMGQLCDPDCADGQKCDLRVGECKNACAASVCPTGQTCTAGTACAVPVEGGLGAPCTRDTECSSFVDGCRDGATPASLDCACFYPVGAQGGVCLAMPKMAQDCAACPEGSGCAEAAFSRAGQATVCIPGGFRACAGAVDCMDEASETPMHCGVFGWPSDPLWTGAASGLGFLTACVSSSPDASIAIGEVCDPAMPQACASGLCLPTPGGGHLCSAACGTDPGCQGIGVGRCVETYLETYLETYVAAQSVEGTTRVCGSSPTLGASCAEASGGANVCGTDAPLCRMHPADNVALCTRSCQTDADCPGEKGFACHPDGFYCF